VFGEGPVEGDDASLLFVRLPPEAFGMSVEGETQERALAR
jgi:hypothetical protein